MQIFRCIVAETREQLAEAQRLRRRVYCEQEAMVSAASCRGDRLVDSRDENADTVHLLVYADREAAGTIRLVCSSAPLPERASAPYASRDGERIPPPRRAVTAEVSGCCIGRPYRATGVTKALFDGLRDESLRRGITHWLAMANAETDWAEDAELAFRVAEARHLVFDGSRSAPESAPPTTPRLRPFYTQDHRRLAAAGALTGLPFPRTLSLFATRMGARFSGPPCYEPYFRVFALPLVAPVRDLRAPPNSDGEPG